MAHDTKSHTHLTLDTGDAGEPHGSVASSYDDSSEHMGLLLDFLCGTNLWPIFFGYSSSGLISTFTQNRALCALYLVAPGAVYLVIYIYVCRQSLKNFNCYVCLPPCSQLSASQIKKYKSCVLMAAMWYSPYP